MITDVAAVVVRTVLDSIVVANGLDPKIEESVVAITVPSLVAAVVSGRDVNLAEVVNKFNGVVVSTKTSKSSASNTCLGLRYDSTVILSASPRATASELVDKSFLCMFSMNSLEFALRTIFSTVSIVFTDDNNSGRDIT